MNTALDSRFAGINPFKSKIWLASPTMHGDEQMWVKDAFDKNWITTAGENINEVERQMAEYIGVNHAIGLSCGTAALHLGIRLVSLSRSRNDYVMPFGISFRSK